MSPHDIVSIAGNVSSVCIIPVLIMIYKNQLGNYKMLDDFKNEIYKNYVTRNEVIERINDARFDPSKSRRV